MSEVHFVPENTVVTEKPVITTKTLPEGVVNTAYRAVLEASPYKEGNAVSWSVIEGELPDGLSLDGKTGVISGTPTTVGASTFTVKASEAGALDAAASFSIKINNAAISFEGDCDLYLSATDKGAIIPESDFSAFVNLSRELTAEEAADAAAELYYNGNPAGEILPVYSGMRSTHISMRTMLLLQTAAERNSISDPVITASCSQIRPLCLSVKNYLLILTAEDNTAPVRLKFYPKTERYTAWQIRFISGQNA